MEEMFSTPIGSMQMSISAEEDEEALSSGLLWRNYPLTIV